MSILGKIFSQKKKMGKQWGIIAQIATQGSMFLNIISLLLLMMTAYTTTLSGWFIQHGIYLKFWMFAIVVLGLLGVASIILWKFAIPSFYSVFNDQFYRHDNPLVKDMELLKRQNQEILEQNKEILEQLAKYNKQ